MTLLTGMAVTLVVWVVSLVRSVQLRALIYSLPLPITLVLVTTHIPVGTQQLLGVVLLNVFVATVAWLHHRLRWHILLADLAGIAAYIGSSWALLQAGRPPFTPILATTLTVWGIIVALQRWTTRRQQEPTHQQDQTPPRLRAVPTLRKLLVLALGAVLMVGLGRLLQGMVVTFPYSGVLVVIETRRDLVDFRAHFTRNSLALLAFVTAYYLTQDVSRYLAIIAGWAAFLVSVLLLHLARRKTKDHSQAPESAHSSPTPPS